MDGFGDIVKMRSLLEASKGVIPLRAAPVPENQGVPSVGVYDIVEGIRRELTQTQSQSGQSNRADWSRIYKDLYPEEPKTQPPDYSGGGGEGGAPPSLGDFSGLTPSFTSPSFWGGFTPSYARTTGSFLGDLARGFANVKGSLSSLKDFMNYGMLASHPLGVGLSVLGFLGLTERSSLNPINNPQVRSALMEIYNQSPAKAVFGSPKAFEGFLSGMFGYGSTLKGVKSPANLSGYFKEILGYVPTPKQIEQMRTNAMDTVRGLGMALTPQTHQAFTTYRDFVNNIRSLGWYDTFPTFADFAKAFDISSVLGISVRDVAIAYSLGFFGKYNIEDLLSNPKSIAAEVQDFVNDMAMRADLQDAVNKAKSNPNMIDEALKEMLEAYETRDRARQNNMSYFEAKEMLEKAQESITEAILGELAGGHLGGVAAVDAVASSLGGDAALSDLGGGGSDISAEAEVAGGGAGVGVSGGLSVDLSESDKDKDNE